MSLAAGARIGRYEILATLGAGGMGEVYSARDPQLDRPVAIKILTSSRQATGPQLERFQLEARAVGRITHPHICTIHDVGQVDGVAFLVMELLSGETLAERLESGPLPVDHALAIAGQIAAALDAAHRKGVIHRDLKPSNVMLTAGNVKLLDFGLAKLRDGDDTHPLDRSTISLRLTEQGTLLGTVPYMAPEQVEGRDVDARTDIFALGVILYEMVSGRPPFQGRSAASLIAAILTQDPQPLTSLRLIPVSVDRVVQKCLAKNPDQRWQSAADLMAALLWSREEAAASQAAVGVSEHVRYPKRTGVAALAVAAAVGGLTVGMLALRLGGSTSTATPRFIPLTFRAGTVSAARFAPDGETVVYSAAWAGERYGLFITRRGSAESRPLSISNSKLLSVSSSGDLAFLRGTHEAVRLLVPPRTGTLARVPMTGGGPRELVDDVVAADWTPNGSDLAVVRRDRVEFPLGKKIHGQHQFTGVRISPDGQQLALVEGPHIVLLDRAGRKRTLSSGWGDMTTLAWSPSGKEVWFAANRGIRDVSVWAIRAVSLAGEERVVMASAGTGIAILDLFRDGRALVATHAGSMGCSCLVPGQMQPRELSWLDGSAPEALAPDGGMVLLSELRRGAGKNGSTYLRKTDGSDAIRLGDGYGEDLSPDGRLVLTAEVPTRQHWVILPTGPGLPRTLPPGPLVARNEANFLPNGRGIVFGGREKDRAPRIYIQDIETGSVRAISQEGVGTTALATPDSRSVIGWAKGQLYKYPVDSGAPVPLTYLDSDDLPLQWSADGSVLYVRRISAWPPVVERVDMATGRRERWKTIQPTDPAGVDTVVRIVVTPDGTAYCHDYVRFLSELFVVEGLQ